MSTLPTAQNGQSTPAPDLATVEKGQEIGSRTLGLTRGDLVRYAGASGDFNPIHFSESMATSVGLPGVIAHGMLTMGAAVQLVTDWAGDPGAVVDYQTRFTALLPVAETTGRVDDDDAPVPGASLQVSGKIGAVNPEEGTVRVDLTVTDPGQDGARLLTKAQAVVRLGAGTGATA